MPSSTHTPIEFWFDFGSPYSYLTTMRIEEEASRRQVPVVWRPFLLGPIFKELGWQGSPFLEQPEKLAYLWKDMARQARKYGLAWQRPSEFPRAAVLATRVAILAAEAPWVAQFCRQVMLKNFVEDQDIGAAGTEAILTELDLPAHTIMTEAQAEPNKLRLRSQTERARALGIFGAPTFFVGGELFWGNDRLDDALALAESVAGIV